MATATLNKLLKSYAGRFVESGSLYAESGDLHADDLYVNVSELESVLGEQADGVELGFNISMIHLSKLKLEIPWGLLTSTDVLHLKIEELTVVLVQQDPRQVSAEELRLHKEARVRAASRTLLERMLQTEAENKGKKSDKGGSGSGSGSGSGDDGVGSAYLMAAIRRVLRRCRPKIEIRKVHLRYEHRGSEGAVTPFSIGVALGELSLDLAAGTVVTRCPRLGLHVAGLGVYLSTGADAETTVLAPREGELIASNADVRRRAAELLGALMEAPRSHEWLLARLRGQTKWPS